MKAIIACVLHEQRWWTGINRTVFSSDFSVSPVSPSISAYFAHHNLFSQFVSQSCLFAYFLLLLFASPLRPHYPIYVFIHQNYPFLTFDNIVPSQTAEVDINVSYFAKILQISGCPWHINKLQPDEEKCKLLLSHSLQALFSSWSCKLILNFRCVPWTD